MFSLHTREELLSCLRQKPMCRIVAYWQGTRAVIEGPSRGYFVNQLRIIDRAHVVSYIAVDSPADHMLDLVQAFDKAAVSYDLPASLTLRVGPGAREWCLPEFLTV